MRTLTLGERAMAASVFGDGLRRNRVRLGRAPFGSFAVTLGSRIYFPGEPPQDFSTEPIRTQAWLVHELTHVWQFQTAPAWTLRSWARTAAAGGYGRGLPGYSYAHPFEWARLNLEQQARVVEDAFRLRAEGRSATLLAYVGRTPFEALTATT